MATVESKRSARKVEQPYGRIGSIDSQFVRESASRLLRLGLNKYETKLNRELLKRIETEFSGWLIEQQKSIDAQVKNVPVAARENWLKQRLAIDRRDPENQPLRFLIDFLFHFINEQLRHMELIQKKNMDFRKTIARVRNDDERHQVILNYAESLGSTGSDLKADRAALGRWFDEEAVTDRYFKKQGESELLFAFTFKRLGMVLAYVFRTAVNRHYAEHSATEENELKLHKKIVSMWKRIELQARVHGALAYEGDYRIHVAALHCLTNTLSQIPKEISSELLSVQTLTFVHRAALESTSNMWVQCEALSILATISMEHALPIIGMRLNSHGEDGDIFVRRHAMKLIEQHLLNDEDRDLDVSQTQKDPSPFVRQKAAKAAFLSDHHSSLELWKWFALDDPIVQVRAAALICPLETECSPLRVIDSLNVFSDALERETDPFVVRTALHASVKLLDQIVNSLDHVDEAKRVPSDVEAIYRERIVPRIRHLEASHEKIPVRRWAAQASERIWGLLDVEANSLIQKLKPELFRVEPGRSKRYPKKLFQHIPETKLGRIFAILAQDDFGYDVHKTLFGFKILRGPSFGLRFWRLYFEFTNTATDKRQALSHTVGRISTSTLRAPSQILGELSETKVPGEPLTIAADGTWRPFLPLADDFVSTLNMSWFGPKTVSFFTSQGITRVTGPKGIWRRIKAAWKLNFRFSKYATSRNWDDDSFAPSTYLDSMRDLGFQIELETWDEQTESKTEPEIPDGSVKQFFVAAGLSIPISFTLFGQSFFESFVWKQCQRFAEYFGSAFENTLEELLVFSVIVMVMIITRHIYINYTFRKARNKIPISLGGWGTRGKSGTERLKAALVGVMGHGLVSKTTGCEAMFIQANAFGEPLEIPLFRPYDKATIWEQKNLILLAAKMNPSVFLWECMALTPSYVNILQRQWMHDDIGTITNTYPDHEDVQGPAGHNVATTISGFAPVNSHLITTEQQMLPYVTESCRKANSTYKPVGWLESGLITEDVLDRFPYQEHPDNIALVAEMARMLGADYEFSLNAMAEYLVPDLGVLKTHPISNVRNRKIEFTNGCSANERFGCMGNWTRLEFDKQDPWTDPCTWISGVVNNRADRVPRSKVFAKIIVEDINADRFFLIGNNLQGLQVFIAEAWEEKAKGISLRDKKKPFERKFALEALKKAAWELRQPIEDSHVAAKAKCMLLALADTTSDPASLDVVLLSNQWQFPEKIKEAIDKTDAAENEKQSVIKHIEELKLALSEYRELLSAIEEAGASNVEALELRFRELLKTWYFRKIVVVEDYFATGEEVLAKVVNGTPIGFTNRIMGLQNIKGTGLDFVYRFQAWDMCFEACNAAVANHVQTAEKGLQSLAAMPAIGQLCQERVREVLEICRQNRALQRSDLQALIKLVESKMQAESGTAGTDNNKDTTKKKGKLTAVWNEWIVSAAEQFLDVNDSIRRRETADQIYRDLGALRISRQRAIVELRKINKRQKGGWLTAKSDKEKSSKSNAAA